MAWPRRERSKNSEQAIKVTKTRAQTQIRSIGTRREPNKIAACGPLGIKTTLISAHLAVDPGEEEALSELEAQFGALIHTQDFLEGRKAEAESRKPVYQGT